MNAEDVKQLPGRPETGKLDAVWLRKAGRAADAAARLRPPAAGPAAAGPDPVPR